MLFMLCSTSALADNKREPHIGYLYPAGAQKGTTVYIIAGGQFLRGATDVHISGPGVEAQLVKYYKPVTNGDDRRILRDYFEEVWNKKLNELGINPDRTNNRIKRGKQNQQDNTLKNQSPQEKENEIQKPVDVKIPEHPLFEDIDKKSLRELVHIRQMFFSSRSKSQPNRQLAEMVLIKITIDHNAKPGDRELRILSPLGLTNPMIFQIGYWPEVNELEPNDDKANPQIPRLTNFSSDADLLRIKPVKLPVVLNGQIMPGDIDRFRFEAKQGQNLVIETNARYLIPYLADAVPGWFQAVITLYDDKGNEIAYADDYRFNPDPVLFYKIPKTGEYELQIYDSIYRGREDFIYRISISQTPFITYMFPLYARVNDKITAEIGGWNLNNTQLTLNTEDGQNFIRYAACENNDWISNSVPYAVDTLPQCISSEDNNTIKNAQKISLPLIINGVIEKPGDIDVFEFSAKTGDKIIAEVYARRLNSPVDSLLRLTDETGKVLVINDDHVTKNEYLYKDITGLITHHADSCLTAEISDSKTYYIHIADSQQQAGQEYSYSLRISPLRPDYELVMTPSSLFVNNGKIVPFCVHVLRKDGFDGSINVTLKNPDSGFKINGGRVPPNCDQIYMTLQAPTNGDIKITSLNLEGTAKINDKIIKHAVIPAEDMMQAFLYRHLVPSKQLIVGFKKTPWRASPFELVGQNQIRIKAGGSEKISVKIPKVKAIKKIELELFDPPEGITITDINEMPQLLTFKILTDKNEIKQDIVDNLIVEAFAELKPGPNKQNRRNQIRRISMGVLPAIPIEIIKQQDYQVKAGF